MGFSTIKKLNLKKGRHLLEADLITYLLQEITVFVIWYQVASCTLDASAKIYAGRVDSIHAQAYKMLGGLGRADNQG